MRIKGGRTVGFVILGLALLVAALSFFAAPVIERRLETQLAKVLSDLPGRVTVADIRVSLLTNSAVIRELEAVLPDADGTGETRFSAAEMRLRGFNWLSGFDSGAALLAGEIFLSDGVFSSTVHFEELDMPARQEVRLKDLALRNIRGETLLLFQSLRDRVPAADIIAAAKNIRVDSVSAEGYLSTITLSTGSMQAAVASLDFRDVTLLSTSEGGMRNVRITAMGSDILTIDKLTLTRALIPDMFSLALAGRYESGASLRELTERDLAAGYAAFENEPLVVEDLTIAGLSFRAMTTEALTAQSVYLNVEASAGKTKIRSYVENVEAPPSVYRLIGARATHFAAVYGRPLFLDWECIFELKADGDKSDLVLKDLYLREKELGALNAEGQVLLTGADSLALSEAERLVRRGSVLVEDSGFLRWYFAAEARRLRDVQAEKAPSAADLRARAAAQQLEEAKETSNPDLRRILEGVAQLLHGPGSLNIAVEPDEPVSLTDDEAVLKATVRFNKSE
jgi:hypothetical protein